VKDLDRQLSLRTRELDVIRAELKSVKEFRRKRAQMQRELDEVLNSLLLLCTRLKSIVLALFLFHHTNNILVFIQCIFCALFPECWHVYSRAVTVDKLTRVKKINAHA